MTALSTKPVIVAGVLPEQPLWVLQVAGEYARSFGASLVCVSVEAATNYATLGLADVSLMSIAVQPDPVDEPDFPEQWLRDVGALLDPRGVEWSARRLVGEAAVEIAALADELNALMIVIGTRHTGVRGTLHAIASGSVALRLAHRQYRPVVVVPVEPVAPEDRTFWETREQPAVS